MPSRRLIIAATAAALALVLAFTLARPSAQQRFAREVEGMIATANRGEHPALSPRVSTGLAAKLEAEFLSPHSAMRVAQNADRNQGRQYRLDGVTAFFKNSRAQIAFLRSGQHGDFANAVRYSMNFTWEEDRWKADSLPVAAGSGKE